MNTSHDPSAFEKWVKTLSWPDRVIARFFPSFFQRYAPEEIKQQWERYRAGKRRPK
jgi:hypothetical protein